MAEDGVETFLGIPYAAAPEGPLRWRKAQPRAQWREVRDATQKARPCPQVTVTGVLDGEEDCLTVNIWKPEHRKAALPVMVFLHGGRHMVGSAYSSGVNIAGRIRTISFEGNRLAKEGEVVVVSLEFRFGAFGYLAHPALLVATDDAANLGLSDQVFGLDWVRRNIGNFGGDAQRLTIFGQSSGATDICALMTAPAANDRFTRAILDSSPYGCDVSTLASMENAALETAKRVGCTQTNPAEVANCLRALPKEDLLNATKAEAGRPVLTYKPWVDGKFLPQDPAEAVRNGTFQPMPIILGGGKDEEAFFRPVVPDEATYISRVRAQFPAIAEEVLELYPARPTPLAAFIALQTHERFLCPTRRVARALSAHQTQPVRRYLLTRALSLQPDDAAGSYHILSQLFVFGLFEKYIYMPTEAERELSRQVQRDWTAFARGESLDVWKPYANASEPVLHLDTPRALRTGADPPQCDFWDAVESTTH
jgi:para-nitrobenzyl esterase